MTSIGILEGFIFYNLVVACLQGQTIGKWVFRLEVRAPYFYSYFFREFFFFLLFPFVFIHFCFTSSLALHEIISKSYLIRR